jgi:hypothetical protein
MELKKIWGKNIMASCSEGVIPIGSLIVVDSGKARVYDSGTDNIEDVIGEYKWQSIQYW